MQCLKPLLLLPAALCAAQLQAARPAQLAPTFNALLSPANGKFGRRLSFGSYLTPAGAAFVLGPRRLLSGYNGKVVELSCTIGSAVQDWAPTKGDVLDANAIAASCNPGPLVPVIGLFDQITGTLMATQATAANRPFLDVGQNDNGAGPPVVFNNATGAISSGIVESLIVSTGIDHKNMSVVMGIRSLATSRLGRYLQIENNASTVDETVQNLLTTNGSLGSSPATGGVAGTTCCTVYTPTRPQAIGFTGSSANRTFHALGTSATATANNATGYTDVTFRLGSTLTSDTSSYKLWGVAVWNSALSAATIGTRLAEMAAIVQEAPKASYSKRIVLAGDSLPWGQGAQRLQNLSYWMQQPGGVSSSTEIVNQTSPGQKLQSMAQNCSAGGVGSTPCKWFSGTLGAANQIVFQEGGTNDFNSGSTITGQQLWGWDAAGNPDTTLTYNARVMLGALQTAGFTKICAVTLIPNASSNYNDTERRNYNALLRAGYQARGYSCLVDPAADNIIGDGPAFTNSAATIAGNTQYFTADKIHLRDTPPSGGGPSGQEIYASYYTAAAKAQGF